MEEDVSSSQLDLYIQCNLSIPAGYSVDIDKVIIKFLWITHIVKQLYSNKDVKKKISMDRQKIRNSLHNIQGKQSWRSNTTRVQDLL